MKELKVVSIDELHSSIRKFIVETKTIIGDYEDMKALILLMIRAGYMFNMDRDRLRDAMEDITFMLCPDDCANKDRVERGLEYDDDDDDGDYDDHDGPDDSDDMGGDMGVDTSVDTSVDMGVDDTIDIEDITQ